MIQKWSAMLCIFLLVPPVYAQPEASSIQEQVSNSPAGTRLRVKLRNGTQVDGKLVSADERSFAVQPGKYLPNARPEPVTVAYRDVRSLKLNPMRGWVKGVIIGGAVFGVLVLGLYLHCNYGNSPTC